MASRLFLLRVASDGEEVSVFSEPVLRRQGAWAVCRSVAVSPVSRWELSSRVASASFPEEV
jgi:hypothetical protein